jgi:5-methylcytosine-specific restriction endonuclease McrA
MHAGSVGESGAIVKPMTPRTAGLIHTHTNVAGIVDSMTKALILNATYEPLSVVPVRRAAVLVLRGRAAVVESTGRILHAEKVQIPAPSVVRLNRFVKAPFARGIAVNRRSIFARDEHECQYCRGPAENLDHIVPRSRGGGHTWANVVACCSRCNARKGDRLLGEISLSLIRRPNAPSRFGWVYARAGTELHPSWARYIA